MKNIQTNIEKKDFKKNIMAYFNQALKNKEFKDFIEQLNVPYETLAQYTSILEESSIEYNHCKNCKSILECKNKVEGYAYLPEVKKDNIHFCYKMCRYKQELEKQKEYLKHVYTFNIPKNVICASMEDIYKNDVHRVEIIKYLGQFILDYQEGKNPKGLYLHGNFGCGKTYLITAMFNELAKRKIDSAIVFWPEYLSLLKSSFNNHDEFKNHLNKIKTVPLLLMDDIGAENTTAWARDEILCPILQYRMEQNLPTFFTSNLDLNSLEHHLSVSKDEVSVIKARRIMERIKQLTVIKEMISKNLRK